MISAAIYAVSVGNASSYKLLFALSILIGMIFSACFGVAMIDVVEGNKAKHILPESSHILAAISIVSILTISLAEKYAKYMVERKKCWKFL